VTRPEELLGEPLIEIVEQQWWTGRDHATQYTALRSLLESCSYVCVDATGVGAGVASWLARAFRSRVEAVQFTRPLKSEMGYELLAAVNGGRVRMYADDGSAECREFWAEVGQCRYAMARGMGAAMNWYVDAREGHDDFVVSLGLCVRAAARGGPEPAGVLMQAPRLYEDGRF